VLKTIEKAGPEFVDHHRISVYLDISCPEFLEISLSFVMIQNTVSRISGTPTFFRQDQKPPCPDLLERALRFGLIEKAFPEFLDYHRISVYLDISFPEFLESVLSFVMI
jgi:hypothetical protein